MQPVLSTLLRKVANLQMTHSTEPDRIIESFDPVQRTDLKDSFTLSLWKYASRAQMTRLYLKNDVHFDLFLTQN